MTVWRWGLGGAALGAAFAVVAFAPASWLAHAVADGTSERLLLADARGSLWQGSAVLVLTGGSGSRDASALPGRVHWNLGLDGTALALRLQQACCINGELQLRLKPGIGRMRVDIGAAPVAGAAAAGPAAGQQLGTWPASWLVGLGTPWNTLQPSGLLQLSSPGLVLEQVQGRWRFSGRADVDLAAIASRISTLAALGSYRLSFFGDAAGADAASVQLSTTSGPLQLSGSGSFMGSGAASRLRFTGQASAAAGSEAVLANLLNIIGRRQGASSLISIG